MRVHCHQQITDQLALTVKETSSDTRVQNRRFSLLIRERQVNEMNLEHQLLRLQSIVVRMACGQSSEKIASRLPWHAHLSRCMPWTPFRHAWYNARKSHLEDCDTNWIAQLAAHTVRHSADPI